MGKPLEFKEVERRSESGAVDKISARDLKLDALIHEALGEISHRFIHKGSTALSVNVFISNRDEVIKGYRPKWSCTIHFVKCKEGDPDHFDWANTAARPKLGMPEAAQLLAIIKGRSVSNTEKHYTFYHDPKKSTTGIAKSVIVNKKIINKPLDKKKSDSPIISEEQLQIICKAGDNDAITINLSAHEVATLERILTIYLDKCLKDSYSGKREE